MRERPIPKDHEVKLGEEEFIVSRTDTSGKITYANRVFMEISGYSERELLGVQHNIIRHPDMPRAVFQLLWDILKQKREFFGFVKNLCKDGSYYWVFANVTPDIGRNGQVEGYYSVRRQPPAAAIRTVEPFYKEMLRIERSASGVKEGMALARGWLDDQLKNQGASYESFVLELYG